MQERKGREAELMKMLDHQAETLQLTTTSGMPMLESKSNAGGGGVGRPTEHARGELQTDHWAPHTKQSLWPLTRLATSVPKGHLKTRPQI